MSTVRVLFVSSHAQLGGAEAYLGSLLDGLGAWWSAGVVVLEAGPFVEELARRGHEPEAVPTGAGPVALLRSARRLRALARRSGADAVHANGIKAALVAALALPGTGLPLVWVKHDFSWDGRLAELVAARSRLVVGVSDAVTAGLRRRKRVRTVRTGIEPPAADAEAGRRVLLDAVGAARTIVVLIGRIHPVKGQLDLLEATPALLARVPDAAVVLVGAADPSTTDYVARVRAQAATLDRVALLDHRDDVADLIGGADLVVVPSAASGRTRGGEGFGLVALEAMALGTPVVGYDDGALREIVGDCGVLVRSGDRDALAEAVSELAGDDRRRTGLAACGRERAAREFGRERWLDSMRALYREAVRR